MSTNLQKFNVNDDVYIVQDYKISKAKVLAVLQVIEEKNAYIEYRLMCRDNKVRLINQAYLVNTLDQAKKAATTNMERIYVQVIESIKNLTEEQLTDGK